MNVECYVFDASALAKTVAPEKETALVQSYLSRAGARFASSRLSLIEMESSLCRHVRDRLMEPSHAREVRVEITQSLMPRLQWVPMDQVCDIAQSLLQSAGPLRTLDSIHLATAKILAAPLVTFDRQLRKAAERAGVQVLPEAL